MEKKLPKIVWNVKASKVSVIGSLNKWKEPIPLKLCPLRK